MIGSYTLRVEIAEGLDNGMLSNTLIDWRIFTLTYLFFFSRHYSTIYQWAIKLRMKSPNLIKSMGPA